MDILSPIEEITRSISFDLASISIVIPYIKILTKMLEKNNNNSGICTMKGELIKSLKVSLCRDRGEKKIVFGYPVGPQV